MAGRRQLLRGACVFAPLAAAGVGLLAGGVPPHARWDDGGGGEGYLDGDGIAAALWGTLLICFGAVAGVQQARAADPEQLAEADRHARRYIHKELMKKHVADWNPGVLQLFFIALQLYFVPLNLWNVVNNLATLPPRDPAVPLNAAKYVIAWFDLPFACLLVGLFLLQCSLACCARSVRTPDLLQSLSLASSFSSMHALAFAGPLSLFAKLSDKFSQVQAEDAAGEARPGCWQRVWSFLLGGLGQLGYLCTVAVGLLSLMVRMSQFDYVATTFVSEWSKPQVFAFIGFVNNLSGMVSFALKAPGANPVDTVLTAAFSGARQARLLPPAWKKLAAAELLECCGGRAVKATLIFATLSAADVLRLLGLGAAGAEEAPPGRPPTLAKVAPQSE